MTIDFKFAKVVRNCGNIPNTNIFLNLFNGYARLVISVKLIYYLVHSYQAILDKHIIGAAC